MDCRYICPVCRAGLSEEEKLFSCSGGHVFDKSAEGYVNLAFVKKANTEKSGDAADMERSRRSFLEGGFYKPLADRICDILSENIKGADGGLIIDAGCGEGYYSRRIKERMPLLDVYGLDLSKQAIKMAAKFEKNCEMKNHYSVCGVFDMPFDDSTAKAVVSVFAPVASGESRRVLEKGGLLIVACPGKNHLYGLKKALYDIPLENEEKFPDYEGFEAAGTETLTYDMALSASDAANLFKMTPYYCKSSKEVREKAENLGNIVTAADFIIKTYKKL